MTLADELGGPLTGATNEKPRLRKQPGFSSVHLRELILPNPVPSQRACGDDIQSQKPPPAMMLQAKAACGDDDDASPPNIGLCSDFYVFKWVLTCDVASLSRIAIKSRSSQRNANNWLSDIQPILGSRRIPFRYRLAASLLKANEYRNAFGELSRIGLFSSFD